MKWLIVATFLWGVDGDIPFATSGEFPTRQACEAAIPSVIEGWTRRAAENPALAQIGVAFDCKMGGKT